MAVQSNQQPKTTPSKRGDSRRRAGKAEHVSTLAAAAAALVFAFAALLSAVSVSVVAEAYGRVIAN